ncbi:MAG: YciI family protein [Pseudomonadota bacterium]
MKSGQKPAVMPRSEKGVFAVWCEDNPAGAASIRESALDGHLAYIEKHFHRYLVAGPMRRGDQELICGSLLVVLAETEAEARELIEGDPYVQCGLYQNIEYRRLTPAAGDWIGGVIWPSADALRNVATGKAKTTE